MHILVLSIYAKIVLAHIPEKCLVFFHELPLLYRPCEATASPPNKGLRHKEL